MLTTNLQLRQLEKSTVVKTYVSVLHYIYKLVFLQNMNTLHPPPPFRQSRGQRHRECVYESYSDSHKPLACLIQSKSQYYIPDGSKLKLFGSSHIGMSFRIDPKIWWCLLSVVYPQGDKIAQGVRLPVSVQQVIHLPGFTGQLFMSTSKTILNQANFAEWGG